MHEPDFNRLKTRMLQNGVAPRHVHRTLCELEDHYRDLVDEVTDNGASVEDANAVASARLGEMDDLIDGMLACREIRGWAYRYPRIAVFFYPLACLLALPALPVIAGARHAPLLARWGASVVLAGLFTAIMMLVMQLSILFG